MSSRKPAVIFIFITLLLDVLGFGLIIPVAPHLVEKLQLAAGITAGEAAAAPIVSWLAVTYALMQFVFAPVLGALSDRFGRRPVLLVSTFGSALDYVAMAFAPTVFWLFVTRAINGISGASMTTATAYIADVTPPEKRAAAFGIVGAAFGLGFTFGPLVGGVLADPALHIPWTDLTWRGDIRYPFFAAGAVTLLNWLYGYFVLPESLAPENRSGRFHLAHANPLGALSILRKYPLAFILAFALFFVNLAQFALQITWVLSTKHRYGWTPKQAGFSLFLVGVGASIVQGGLARRIIPAMGERAALILGLSVSVCAFIGYGLAPKGWMVYVIIAVGSLAGIAMPAAQALITRPVSPDEQGRVQGAITSGQSIAQVIGFLTGGYVFAFAISSGSRFHLPGLHFLVCAALAAMGTAVAAYALFRRAPQTATSSATPDALRR